MGSGVDPGGFLLTLGERWNGTVWSTQKTVDPPGGTNSSFRSVSCPAATACLGVGNLVDASGDTSLLSEGWNGSGWTIKTVTTPSGAKHSILRGVSCSATNACTAVGGYNNVSLTLAERWNGTVWAIQPTPNPTPGSNATLNSVSCPALSGCTAVGSYVNSLGATVTLAEAWSAGRWMVRATLNPAGAKSSVLRSVSCPTANVCVAVGDSVSPGGTISTLSEVWNGNAWAILHTPNPTGTTTSRLRAVSCTSPTACVAVGEYLAGGGTTAPYSEVLSGKSWTVHLAAIPAGSSGSLLSAVSCSAATVCTAVGSSTDNAGTTHPLAEGWAGSSWTLQSLPTVPDATQSSLRSVSCTPGRVCSAVGYASRAVTTPLAMRHS